MVTGTAAFQKNIIPPVQLIKLISTGVTIFKVLTDWFPQKKADDTVIFVTIYICYNIYVTPLPFSPVQVPIQLLL